MTLSGLRSLDKSGPGWQFRFCWHKTHRRPRNRLTDRGGIIGVVLAALEIGLHIARGHQLHHMAERLKLAAPMMCARTRLNTHQTWRQSHKDATPSNG